MSTVADQPLSVKVKPWLEEELRREFEERDESVSAGLRRVLEEWWAIHHLPGIEFRDEDGSIYVDNLDFGGPAEQLGIDWDWELVELEVPADRMPKEIFYIPALLLVLLVVMLQRGRQQPQEALA